MLDTTYTFTIFIDGLQLDSTKYFLESGGLSVREGEGSEINTATIVLVDNVGDFDESAVAFKEIVVYGNYGLSSQITVFGGIIVKSNISGLQQDFGRLVTLECEGYASFLRATEKLRTSYTDMSAGTIVASMFSTLGLTQFNTSTYVDVGPTIEVFNLHGENIAKALDRLSELCGYVWYIDYDKNVIFKAHTGYSAPFAVGTVVDSDYSTRFPMQAGSWMLNPDSTNIINKVIIFGGYKDSAKQIEYFSGDDSTVRFSLANKPIRRIDRISYYTGGVWDIQSHGVAWYDTFGGGFDCLVNYAAGSIEFAIAPTAGTNNIKVEYYYEEQVKVVRDRTNNAIAAASYTKFGRDFVYEIDDRSISSDSEAIALADAIISNYSDIRQSGSFSIEKYGLHPSMYLDLQYNQEGFAKSVVIRRVTYELNATNEGFVCNVEWGGRETKLSQLFNDTISTPGVVNEPVGGPAYSVISNPRYSGEVGVFRVRDAIMVGSEVDDYLTGVGIFMGLNANKYRMHIGDPSGDHLAWDGTNLYVTGNFIGGSNIFYTEADSFTINYDRDVATSTLTFGGSGGDGVISWNGSTYKFMQGDLHVFGSGYSKIIVEQSGSRWIELFASADPTILWESGGSLKFGTATNYDATGWIERVRIDANGNVGIGTAIPTSKLHVAGDARVDSNLYASYADISGALNVGQDLTVGGGTGVLFVDASGQRVGINTTPDAQFDLDVAGNMRAQGWIVGRHAIQLNDAEMICHFDGPQPYETNFTGETTGHRGQVANVSGGVIFRPGKFGKAVQIAEASQNLIKNPRFANDIANWASNSASVLTRVTTGGIIGDECLEVASGGGQNFCQAAVGVDNIPDATVTYTFSAYYKLGSLPPGGTVVLMAYWIGGANPDGPTYVRYIGASQSNGWHRISAQFTPDYADRTSVVFYVRIAGATADGQTIYIDAAQVEQKTYITPYLDGSLGDGYSWSGAAHASTSSRASAGVTYSINNVSNDAGTVMFWFYADSYTSRPALLDMSMLAAGGLRFFEYKFERVFDVGISNVWSSSDIGVWVHIAGVWDGTTLRAYKNGSLVGTVTMSDTPTLIGPIDLLRVNQVDPYRTNGLIDDFVIFKRALSDDEIRAIYESNAPVFAETSTWQFRATPKGLVWADEEGLWMRSEAGDAVLGVYGGEAGGKSWGGQTLDTGDLMIGNGSHYMLWDNSASKLTISGTVQILDGSASGWTFDANAIIKDTGVDATSAGMSPSDFPFYAGATYANRATAPFRVTPAGAMYATSGEIGGFTIGSTSLYSGNMVLDAANKRIWWDSSAYIQANAGGGLFMPQSLTVSAIVYSGTFQGTILRADSFGRFEHGSSQGQTGTIDLATITQIYVSGGIIIGWS